MKSSAAGPELTIGELAGHFGLGTHVLRHWEAVGLLAPRRVNGRRCYAPDSRTRVAIILHAKQLGLSLEQVRALISGRHQADCRALLAAHRAELESRVAHARAAIEVIDHALDCSAEDFTTCPDFQRLVHEPRPPA